MNAEGLAATALRWLVVGLWTASALSQLHAEWNDWRTRAPSPHPEMPAEEQERAAAVLLECSRRVSAGDLLVVSGGDDAVEVFLRYRLAYELYPARVVDAPGTPDALQAALLQPGGFRERYALVLGRPDLEIPDTLALSLSPKDRLFEAGEPRPMTWALVLPPLLGYLLWERVQGARHHDTLEALGMALPLGAGVTAFAALALEPLGAGLGSTGLTAALFLATLAGVLARAATKTPVASASERMPLVVWACAAAVLCEIALLTARVLEEGRFSDWDAWAIWDMKARAFHANGGVAAYLSRGADLAFSWPSRPPLTSVFQAFVYTCLGGASETAARFFHVALYASLLLLFFALVRRSCGPAVAAAGAALLASVPNVLYHASSGVANLALGVYLLALLIALERGFARGGPRALLAAGALAGFVALCRDEGRWLALVALVAASVVGLVQGRAARRVAGGALLCGLVSALVYAPWAAAVARSGAQGMLSDWSVADTLHRIPAHLKDLPAFLHMSAREIFLPVEQAGVSPLEDALGVALFWPTFFLASARLPLQGRRDPLAWAAALTSLGGLCLYAAGLWLFPYEDLADLQHHWVYVLDRHLIAVVPAAAYAIVLACAPRPRREASPTNAAPSTPRSVSHAPTATERGA